MRHPVRLLATGVLLLTPAVAGCGGGQDGPAAKTTGPAAGTTAPAQRYTIPQRQQPAVTGPSAAPIDGGAPSLGSEGARDATPTRPEPGESVQEMTQREYDCSFGGAHGAPLPGC